MMSGLRSQRDKIMTWVSLRSGMASRGRCIMDQAPQVQAAATSAKTRYLFFTDNSIIRLIIHASVRARILCEFAYLHARFTHSYGGLIGALRFRGRRQDGGAHAAFGIDQKIP